MKIAVSGTHSTGKTTFLRNFYDHLLSKGMAVKMIANDATVCPLPIKKDQTFASTMWLFANCIKNETEACDGCHILLVDRAIIDAWGYYRASKRYVFDAKEEKVAMGIIQSWMSTYLQVVTSTVNYKYEKYFSPSESKYRLDVEKAILSTYKQLNLQVCHLDFNGQELQFDSIIGLK